MMLEAEQSMDLRRACIHEAGHLWVAYQYRRGRAISIRISKQVKVDANTNEQYLSLGHAVTLDFPNSPPRVLVSIRAAGLAAESVVYNEEFDNLMRDPSVRRSIKTDTDNAWQDLQSEKLLFPSSSDEEFVHLFRMGFDDAVIMLRSSQDKLLRIADYCLQNQDRDIPIQELIANCDLD